MMSDFHDSGLFQFFTSTSTTTEARQSRKGDKGKDIELDDTAPLPLLIGIGLALFLGFVILVLICCLCRRRRPPTGAPNELPQHPNSAGYQRAPVNDGMGGGVAYPMTAVPPNAFHNAIPYNPHMGNTVQHNYGVIGSGMKFSNAPHSQYNHQPPHFGGVPTFPPNQYIPSLPPPHSVGGHQSHSLSHSSQASSSVSGATADPLVPMSSSPSVLTHQQLQHQQQLQQHQQQMQQHQYQLQQFQYMTAPPSALQHHQHIQNITGRESPSFQYAQMTYSAMLANEQAAATTATQGAMVLTDGAPPVSNAVGTTAMMATSITSPPPNRPVPNHQPPPVQTPQSSSCTEEE